MKNDAMDWFNQQSKKTKIMILVGVILVTILLVLPKGSKELDSFLVTRVIDGDTFEIQINENQTEKVRLIGVDAPESVHPDENRNSPWGVIASEYTKNELEWRRVQVELDVQERDQYGRLLAYVYVDGNMFNETLLYQGLATIYTVPPNVKYVENFSRMQKEAKQAERGIWSDKGFMHGE